METGMTGGAIQAYTARITGGFWARVQSLVLDTVIPYQAELLDDKVPGAEKSFALENFRVAAGLKQGGFGGMVFQDSDAAKWLEAAAYSLAIRPDAGLEKKVDEVIALVGAAQQPDGYLDTYFIIKEPGRKWQNLSECHELYCAGHFIEAACALYEAAGKDSLLNIMRRTADLICARFGAEDGQTRGIPGHPEIELALLRLYRATGEERYLKTARYFLDERGTEPDFFARESAKRGWHHWGPYNGDRKYAQNHAPVREQKEAAGHAVRAVYLYTAMAMCAAETGDDGSDFDESLFQACYSLWNNITTKQMYITGGIGATASGEAFTQNYDLPNDTAYAETCASIGMVFFAKSMIEAAVKLEHRLFGGYADIIERELYNGVLSGMQLDGKRFFYVNPLEAVPGVSGVLPGYKHALPERPQWFGCACCPPNLARLAASLGSYVYTHASQNGRHTIYCHLFTESETRFDVRGTLVTITQKTQYPWDGKIEFAFRGFSGSAGFAFAVRIPEWCTHHTLTLNGGPCEAAGGSGYAIIEREWQSGDGLCLTLEMQVRLAEANPHVREDAGKVAVMRGPVVYCLEEACNGEELWNLRLASTDPSAFTAQTCAELGVTLSCPGKRTLAWESAEEKAGAKAGARGSELPSTTLYPLYRALQKPEEKDVSLHWIPYYAWANSGLGEMAVWVRT